MSGDKRDKMAKKAVILAAGKGTRMKSPLPKVLFLVAGRPILDYVLDALETAGIDESILVVGYQAEQVRKATASRRGVLYVEQTQQLGTGHAVMSARSELLGYDGPVFVIAGDSPMLRPESVAALFDEYAQRKASGKPASAILGTAIKENPFGMGRILRDADGEFLGVIEEKDANEQQRKITEINMSYYVFQTPDLLEALDALTTANAQREYYITDVPAILRGAGKTVLALPVLAPEESLGVNTVEDALAVESEMKRLGKIRVKG